MSDPHVQPEPEDDFEGPARDRLPIRCLRAEDLAEVIRIDRLVTGREHPEYMRRKFDEVLEESAIRMSLVAESDGRPVGFVMARVDSGDFGQTEPVAVIDTLGVDPRFRRQGVGKALLSQLLMNLRGLRVERVETQARQDDFEMLGFFYRCGFGPSHTLTFHKRVT